MIYKVNSRSQVAEMSQSQPNPTISVNSEMLLVQGGVAIATILSLVLLIHVFTRLVEVIKMN